MSATVLTVQELGRLLQDRNLTKVAEATGIPYHHLRQLKKRVGNDSASLPYSTIETLTNYLRG